MSYVRRCNSLITNVSCVVFYHLHLNTRWSTTPPQPFRSACVKRCTCQTFPRMRGADPPSPLSVCLYVTVTTHALTHPDRPADWPGSKNRNPHTSCAVSHICAHTKSLQSLLLYYKCLWYTCETSRTTTFSERVPPTPSICCALWWKLQRWPKKAIPINLAVACLCPSMCALVCLCMSYVMPKCVYACVFARQREISGDPCPSW